MAVTAQQKAAYDAFDDALRALADATVHYRKVLADYDDLRESVNINDAEQLDEAKRAYAGALNAYDEMRVAYVVAVRAWVEANPIRVERKAREMTLLDLAIVAGKTIGAIQLWERGGAKRPDVQGIENIASYFVQPDLREQLQYWKTLRPLAIFPGPPQEIPGA